MVPGSLSRVVIGGGVQAMPRHASADFSGVSIYSNSYLSKMHSKTY